MGAVASFTRPAKGQTENNANKSPTSNNNGSTVQQRDEPNRTLALMHTTSGVSASPGRSPGRATHDSPLSPNTHNNTPHSPSSLPTNHRSNFSTPSSATGSPSPLMFMGRQHSMPTDPAAVLARGGGGGEDEEEDESPSARMAAELFAHTALSLGMDNEDLLLNLMYFSGENGFGEGNMTFGNMLNTMQQETVALHSANNTPYKLHPADEDTIAGLTEETYHAEESKLYPENECLVCRDELEDHCALLRIPTCKHYFHADCLLRWINLQAWCPVCRASLEHLQQPQATTTVVASSSSNRYKQPTASQPFIETILEQYPCMHDDQEHNSDAEEEEEEEEEERTDGRHYWQATAAPEEEESGYYETEVTDDDKEEEYLASRIISKRLLFDYSDDPNTNHHQSGVRREEQDRSSSSIAESQQETRKPQEHLKGIFAEAKVTTTTKPYKKPSMSELHSYKTYPEKEQHEQHHNDTDEDNDDYKVEQQQEEQEEEEETREEKRGSTNNRSRQDSLSSLNANANGNGYGYGSASSSVRMMNNKNHNHGDGNSPGHWEHEIACDSAEKIIYHAMHNTVAVRNIEAK